MIIGKWNRPLFMLLILLGIYVVGYSFWEAKIMPMRTSTGDWSKSCLSAELRLNKTSACWDNSSQELYLSIQKGKQDRPVPIKGFQLLIQNNRSRSKDIRITQTEHESIKMQDKTTFKFPIIEQERDYIVSVPNFSDVVSVLIAPMVFAEGAIRLCSTTSSAGVKPCSPTGDENNLNGTRIVSGVTKYVDPDIYKEFEAGWVAIIVSIEGESTESVISSVPSSEMVVRLKSSTGFSGSVTQKGLDMLINDSRVISMSTDRMGEYL